MFSVVFCEPFGTFRQHLFAVCGDLSLGKNLILTDFIPFFSFLVSKTFNQQTGAGIAFTLQNLLFFPSRSLDSSIGIAKGFISGGSNSSTENKFVSTPQCLHWPTQTPVQLVLGVKR
jgi:uncharacterized membrane protein YcgQ (UPF0703/DUF1980 family)